MRKIRHHIKTILSKTLQNKEPTCVFEDLQDTPDTSKKIYYGLCKLAKHPLGIVNICESFGMECTGMK